MFALLPQMNRFLGEAHKFDVEVKLHHFFQLEQRLIKYPRIVQTDGQRAHVFKLLHHRLAFPAFDVYHVGSIGIHKVLEDFFAQLLFL